MSVCLDPFLARPARAGPAVGRHPAWSAALATLGVVALLIAFQHVVHELVDEAAARHKARAELAAAVSRCNGLKGRPARNACAALLHRNPVAPGAALQPLRPAARPPHDGEAGHDHA